MYKLLGGIRIHIDGEQYFSCEIQFQDINGQITDKKPHLLVQNQNSVWVVQYVYIRDKLRDEHIFNQKEIAIFEADFNNFLTSIWSNKPLRIGDGYAYPMRSTDGGKVLQVQILSPETTDKYFTLTLNAYD